ncbi:MAG: hypothetical protein A2X64_01725 [Ignavibacteria bacterium GWF2_33_9]|nr:MAG: hypothetical protein A2X64_01725 [Ignavibacteria bacterium GWF2_33_9]
MKTILLIMIIMLSSINLSAKTAPSIEWAKSYGGNGYDQATSIDNTKDGGYIICGSTGSNNYDVNGNHGESDYWIIKLNANGKIEWQKCLGGTNGEGTNFIKQTSDGGYIVVGDSFSNDGDVTGNHGGADCLIFKLDSVGSIQWQKCFGGKRNEKANSIIQTSDGGYIFAGTTISIDGDVFGKHNELDEKYQDHVYFSDCWIVKLDSNGSIQWQKCLGGNNNDQAKSIQQTSDGGYIVAGSTESHDGDVSGFHGDTTNILYIYPDYWLVKLNSLGEIEWQKCYGGTSYDWAYSIINTIDGGYALTGISHSNDGDVIGNHSTGYYPDFWTLKLSALGEIEWQKCNGNYYNDGARSIIQTQDGFVIIGYASSFDGGENASHGFEDYGIVKLSLDGKTEWQKMFGSYGGDWPEAIIQSQDGGYVAVGYASEKNGDVTNFYGKRDFWVLKLSPEGDDGIKTLPSTQIGLRLYPNPVEDRLSIEYNLDEPENVQIVVYSLLGEEMLSVNCGLQSEGGHLYQINTDKLPQGMYKLILRAGENQFPTKFIKVK